MIRAGLLLIKIGEDGQITQVYAYLELVQRRNNKIAFFMTADKKELPIIVYLDSISLIRSLNHWLWAAYNLIYGEGLLCD